jgi:NADH-quinone oxidoreductase subunit J
VIVYAGAIVVLFLFVIMLLGVDQVEDLDVEPLAGQRVAGILTGVGLLVAAGAAFVLTNQDADELATGRPSVSGALDAGLNVEVLGRSIFTDNLFAFEITSVLLVIAVVGAVVLARTPRLTREELQARQEDDA